MSNLSFLSKLLERAVFIQLSEHIERHDLLPDHQSAYRRNYSTETILLSVQNDMLLAADTGVGCAVVLLDCLLPSARSTTKFFSIVSANTVPSPGRH
jgi:hypothetical protein